MRFVLFAASAAGLFAAACTSTPTFRTYGIDASVECDEETGLECGSGQVCLQHRCYDECTASSCGPGETCIEGVCRGFSGDAGRDGGRDAPTPDTPPDPCATAGCTAPTPFCIPGTGVCVACMSQADCPPTAPICDVSTGTCVPFDGANLICAPCNRDLDCAGAGTCVMRDREQVCLPSSATPPCPAGMEVNGAVCQPALGQSCRSYVRARSMAGCTTANDCVPIGTDPFPGLCPAGICTFACGMPSDCPPGWGTCGGDMYCAP